MITFMGEEIVVGKRYVYLKNERTGSSTIRKLKMVGECVDIKKNKVIMKRLYCAEYTYYDHDGEDDSLLNIDDIICEWKPTQEQWKCEVE